MLIYLSEPEEINEEAKKMLRDAGHELVNGVVNDTEQANIEALFIRTYTKADKNYLAKFPGLKYLLRAGVGLDNVDIEECRRRSITILNAPGSNANAVAEFCVGMIIMLLRQTSLQVKSLKAGQWRQKELIGSEISGKVMGLIGCGAIGRLLVSKLSGFGLAKILGYDPYLDKQMLAKNRIDKTDLDSIFRESDIITLHLPLTEETENLVDRSKLALMKETAIIINTSRGGIVNEQDLCDALINKKIGGAALDVFIGEPEIDRKLLDVPNLICTPHIAGFTAEADREMAVIPVKKFLEELRIKI